MSETMLWAPGRRIRKMEAITPSDTGTHEYDGFFVGTAGQVNALPRDNDSPVPLPNLSNSSYHPINIKRIYLTDTDARDIFGFFLD